MEPDVSVPEISFFSTKYSSFIPIYIVRSCWHIISNQIHTTLISPKSWKCIFFCCIKKVIKWLKEISRIHSAKTVYSNMSAKSRTLTWLYPMLTHLFCKCMQINVFLIRESLIFILKHTNDNDCVGNQLGEVVIWWYPLVKHFISVTCRVSLY